MTDRDASKLHEIHALLQENNLEEARSVLADSNITYFPDAYCTMMEAHIEANSGDSQRANQLAANAFQAMPHDPSIAINRIYIGLWAEDHRGVYDATTQFLGIDPDAGWTYTAQVTALLHLIESTTDETTKNTLLHQAQRALDTARITNQQPDLIVALQAIIFLHEHEISAAQRTIEQGLELCKSNLLTSAQQSLNRITKHPFLRKRLRKCARALADKTTIKYLTTKTDHSADTLTSTSINLAIAEILTKATNVQFQDLSTTERPSLDPDLRSLLIDGPLNDFKQHSENAYAFAVTSLILGMILAMFSYEELEDPEERIYPLVIGCISIALIGVYIMRKFIRGLPEGKTTSSPGILGMMTQYMSCFCAGALMQFLPYIDSISYPYDSRHNLIWWILVGCLIFNTIFRKSFQTAMREY